MKISLLDTNYSLLNYATRRNYNGKSIGYENHV
ncbi:MAG: hypothetical protein ACI81T_000636 [Bacteroidia bacterium]|jgi:hypothetical protein